MDIWNDNLLLEADQKSERALRDSLADNYISDIELSRGPYWMQGQIGMVLSMLHLGSRHHLYDAGTGVGIYALEIARRYPSVRITASDFSPRSIEMLQEEVERRGYRNIHGIVADIVNHAPEPESFDRAICNDVLQHLPGHEARLQAVRNILQGLRKDGIFVTTNYRWGGWIKPPAPKEDRNYRGIGLHRFAFTEEELGDLLHEAGLRDVHSVAIVRTPRKLRRHLPAAMATTVESLLLSFGLFGRNAQYVMAWGRK
jgi:SAM-dependent methyltransferase